MVVCCSDGCVGCFVVQCVDFVVDCVIVFEYDFDVVGIFFDMCCNMCGCVCGVVEGWDWQVELCIVIVFCGDQCVGGEEVGVMWGVIVFLFFVQCFCCGLGGEYVEFGGYVLVQSVGEYVVEGVGMVVDEFGDQSVVGVIDVLSVGRGFEIFVDCVDCGIFDEYVD